MVLVGCIFTNVYIGIVPIKCAFELEFCTCPPYLNKINEDGMGGPPDGPIMGLNGDPFTVSRVHFMLFSMYMRVHLLSFLLANWCHAI